MKIMKIRLAITAAIIGMCSLVNVLPLSAQNKFAVVVSGKIVELDGESIPFASVRIRPIGVDSTQIFSQVTDNNGVFRIGLPHAKSYRLMATYVGMETINKDFTVPADKKEYSLGNLTMKTAVTELQGVTVTKARKLVKIDVDKIAYSVKEDPESRTTDLLKMLRKVPLVTVDGQGNIQVNGSSNFKIYQNGKPNSMFNRNAKDVLKSIPASSIKRVEVITDPGVKYDAESSGAILNIITDDGKSLAGVAGTVSAAYGSYGNWMGGLFLNAKSDKWGFTGNLTSGGFGQPATTVWSDVKRDALHTESNSTMRNQGNFNMFNATLTYEIDSLNLISISGNGMPYKVKSQNTGTEKAWKDNSLISNRNSLTDASQNFGSYAINADFQHSTRMPGELLTVSYMFDRSPNNSKSGVVTEMLDPVNGKALPDGFAEEFSKSTSAMNEHTSQLDYTRPLFGRRKHQLETGLKFIARRSESTPLYQIRRSPDGEFEIGSLFGQHLNSSNLRYSQDIYAAYVGWTAKWTNKFSSKVGARAEYSLLDVRYDQKPEADFKRKAMDWVPQVRLAYNPSLFNQWALSYNFRIQRPGISQMNPYRKQEGEYSVQYGNPNLEAQLNHNIELSFNYFKDKISLNNTLAYQFCNNLISSHTISEKGVLQTTYDNLGRSRSYSFNTFINYNPWSWMRIFVNGNVSYSQLRNPSNNISENWWSTMSFVGSNIILPKKWMVFVNAGGFKQESYQQNMDFSYFTSLTVSKSLLKDKLNVSLSFIEPLRNQVTYRSRMHGVGFRGKTASTMSSRMLSLNLSYSFGELKQQIKSVQRKIVNDDLMKQQKKQGSGSGVPNM